MSTHLGTTGFLDTPTVNGLSVITTSGGVPTIGSGTSLPAAGIAGRWFLNTNTDVMYRDTGSAWIRMSGPVLQAVVANIPVASTNVVLPFDATLPLNTEGGQAWSQSFTPIAADSTIVITVSSFFTVSSSASLNIGGALFNGTTCFAAQMLGFTTDASDGNNFCMIASQSAGSTTARTYSFRYGSSAAATVYLGSSNGGANYGGANIGTYTIVEYGA